MQAEKDAMETGFSRLFIGTRPDERAQRYFDGLVSQYQAKMGAQAGARQGRVRWTSSANRHLTLAFLGETPDSLIPRIGEKLMQIASALPACSGRLVCLQPFPKKRARLLAAELLPNPALDRLHSACRQLMIDLGMTPESVTYRPHVTLARNRAGFAVKPQELDQTMALDNLTLYRSDMAPGGSQYTPLLEASLLPAPAHF